VRIAACPARQHVRRGSASGKAARQEHGSASGTRQRCRDTAAVQGMEMEERSEALPIAAAYGRGRECGVEREGALPYHLGCPPRYMKGKGGGLTISSGMSTAYSVALGARPPTTATIPLPPTTAIPFSGVTSSVQRQTSWSD
jgi:hypothetical protein